MIGLNAMVLTHLKDYMHTLLASLVLMRGWISPDLIILGKLMFWSLSLIITLRFIKDFIFMTLDYIYDEDYSLY